MSTGGQDGVDVIGAADGAHKRLVHPRQLPLQPVRLCGRLCQGHPGHPCFVCNTDHASSVQGVTRASVVVEIVRGGSEGDIYLRKWKRV